MEASHEASHHETIPILALDDEARPQHGAYVMGPMWQFECVDCSAMGDVHPDEGGAVSEAGRHSCPTDDPKGLLRELRGLARQGGGDEVLRKLRDLDV